MSQIAAVFEDLRQNRKTALMPYLTLGYPQRESALALVPALVEGGADLIELGVPFGDPLADGATIQAASQKALENGMSLALCLEQVAMLRIEGVSVPLVLMGYYNPILQMGIECFARRASEVGVDGAIVPDLPPEEAGELRSALSSRGVDLVFLLAPTSDRARIDTVVKQASGFLYLVSLIGVTGARESLPAGLGDFCDQVRAARTRGEVDLPLAVGFGIGTPEQAARVASIADGVIVGSALIRAISRADEAGQDPALAARAFVRSLRNGIDSVII
jgi:tryptophan synthase alpha chain